MPSLAAVCQTLGHRGTRRPGWARQATCALRASVFALGAARRAHAAWVWLLPLLLLLSLLALPAAAQGVEVLDLKAGRDEAAITLDYQLRLALPTAVEAALLRGVPVYFAAQASTWRPRWYWRDERIGRAWREWRLSYQPLTSSWRISQGGLGQSFASLPEALSAMTRGSAWRIADAREAEPDGRHYVEFSWRLDTTQLPRPMQIGLSGIGGASEWSLGIERTIPLGSAVAK